MMLTVGYMPMPADFRYKAIYDRGKPSLPKKHPMMDTGHRAKIFAPFDALRGFNLAIMSKEVPYVPKRMLEEEEQAELNRRLTILHNLTFNGRMARTNRPVAAITYYVPCADRNHEAYGWKGTYTTIKDIAWNVDFVNMTVLIGKTRVRIADISDVTADEIFDEGWEHDAV